MPGMLLKLKRSQVITVLAASVSCTALASSGAAAQSSLVGPVTGVIDDVRYEGNQYYVFGWACQQVIRSSIEVHVYANRAAGDPAAKFVTNGKADLSNEPAVDQECHDATGGQHRFKVALPNQLLRTFQKKKLFVHGIARTDNVENAAVAGSGNFRFPPPRWPVEPPSSIQPENRVSRLTFPMLKPVPSVTIREWSISLLRITSPAQAWGLRWRARNTAARWCTTHTM